MSIYEICASAVASLGIPYAKGHYEPADGTQQLPDQYLVYNVIDSPGTSWADGAERAREYRVQFSYFTRDGALLNTVPDTIEAAVIAAGLTGGGWSDFPYDSVTRHEGVHADFYYYERR